MAFDLVSGDRALLRVDLEVVAEVPVGAGPDAVLECCVDALHADSGFHEPDRIRAGEDESWLLLLAGSCQRCRSQNQPASDSKGEEGGNAVGSFDPMESRRTEALSPSVPGHPAACSSVLRSV